jgi:hypothetical protein
MRTNPPVDTSQHHNTESESPESLPLAGIEQELKLPVPLSEFYPVAALRDRLPKKRDREGRPVRMDVRTLHRVALEGEKPLRVVKIFGKPHSCDPWAAAWLAQHFEGDAGGGEPARRSPSRRNRDISAAKRRLTRAGI